MSADEIANIRKNGINTDINKLTRFMKYVDSGVIKLQYKLLELPDSVGIIKSYNITGTNKAELEPIIMAIIKLLNQIFSSSFIFCILLIVIKRKRDAYTKIHPEVDGKK